MFTIPSDKADYYARRANTPCRGCRTLDQVDPISILCGNCWSKYRSHGSPTVPKPTLDYELQTAYDTIRTTVELEDAATAFDDWMLAYASPTKKDELKRLCWLNFVQLKRGDGTPLMTLADVVAQALSVTIYDRRGGRFDHKRKQLQYCLGRASVTVWNKKRQVGNGTVYDHREKWLLLRKPELHHRAFHEVFMGAGIARFIAKLNKL